jgi:hypothetical protein
VKNGAVGDAEPDLKQQTERWFVRRGLPHFIDRYNAREDIFTRAAPFLSVVFVAGLVNIRVDDETRWWQNVISIVAGLVIGLGLFALVNRVRGRRYLERPKRIGLPELGIFVFIPAIAQLVVDGPEAAISAVVGAFVLLGLTYIVTSYGLIPMTRWAVVQMFSAFRQVTNLFVRSLPLLLLFTMFMFFNAELWKIADDIPDAFLWTAILTMVLVGSAFILLRFPQELRALTAFRHWAEVKDEASSSPLADVDVSGLDDPPEVARLQRRDRLNVGLVLFFSQAVQVLLVSVTVFVFYMAFGTFTVLDTTIVQWTGSETLDTLWTFEYFGTTVGVTGELVRSSLFIAAIAGLQFTVSAAVDSAYRDEFFGGLIHELRASLATRALYLTLLPDEAPDADGTVDQDKSPSRQRPDS